MMEKLRLNQAIIVEGKYDKIKLASLIDALIITTDGYGVFKNSELRTFIKELAERRGIIVLTDSDAAGFKIRGYLSGIVPKNRITHVFIPDILGKEKRKNSPSAEGKLGVEGVKSDILMEAFRKAGVESERASINSDPITSVDFFEDGLSGGECSRERRYALYDKLALPRRLSTSSAIDILNSMMSREEYKKFVASLSSGKR